MDLRLAKGVEQVLVISCGAAGKRTVRTVYRRRRKSKPATPGFQQLEKMARTLSTAQRACLDSYVSLHEQSNQERADGWMRDLPYNMFRAGCSGMKKFMASCPMPWS
jgi:hypothetical protein